MNIENECSPAKNIKPQKNPKVAVCVILIATL